jgi:hypothetical protein
MCRTLLVLPDPIARARCVAALRRLGFDTDADAAPSPRPELVVVDPFLPVGDWPLPADAAGAPGGPVVVAYGDFRRGPARTVVDLVRAGVDEVVVFDEEDEPFAFAQRLANVLGRAVAVRFRERCEPLIPRSLAPFLSLLLAATLLPVTPGDAARLAYCHPVTLRNRLRRAGLPPVNKLIGWMRIFHAAHRIELIGRVERVALSLSFPSDAALRNLLRRHTGLRARDLARPDSLDALLRTFERRWRADDWSLSVPWRRDSPS